MPNWFQKEPAYAAVASATNQLHWYDPSISTESNRGKKKIACFSLLGVVGLTPAGPVIPTLVNGLPKYPASTGLA